MNKLSQKTIETVDSLMRGCFGNRGDNDVSTEDFNISVAWFPVKGCTKLDDRIRYCAAFVICSKDGHVTRRYISVPNLELGNFIFRMQTLEKDIFDASDRDFNLYKAMLFVKDAQNEENTNYGERDIDVFNRNAMRNVVTQWKSYADAIESIQDMAAEMRSRDSELEGSEFANSAAAVAKRKFRRDSIKKLVTALIAHAG